MSRLVVLAIMLLAQFTNGVPAAKRIEKAGMIEGHKTKEGPNESNGPSAKVALLTKNVTKGPPGGCGCLCGQCYSGIYHDCSGCSGCWC